MYMYIFSIYIFYECMEMNMSGVFDVYKYECAAVCMNIYVHIFISTNLLPSYTMHMCSTPVVQKLTQPISNVGTFRDDLVSFHQSAALLPLAARAQTWKLTIANTKLLVAKIAAAAIVQVQVGCS